MFDLKSNLVSVEILCPDFLPNCDYAARSDTGSGTPSISEPGTVALLSLGAFPLA